MMYARKRKLSDSQEPGESTASLCTGPDAGQRGAGALPAAESREGRKGQAGAPRQAWGWAPLLLGKGAQLGLWLPWACHGPFPSTTSSQHGRHRAGPWGQPSGTSGPASCSPLLAFALSSAVCVLCGRADVDPNICGHTLDEKGIRVHQYCLVSSLVLLPNSCWGCSFPFCPNEILLFSLLQEFAITFTEASLIRLATEGLPLGAIRRAAKHATKQVRTRTKQADLCHEGLTPA